MAETRALEEAIGIPADKAEFWPGRSRSATTS